VLVLDADELPVLEGTALKSGVVVVDARSHPSGWLLHQAETLPEAVSLLIPVPDGVGPTVTASRLVSLVAMYQNPAITSIDT
jgi:hypothetical protein